MLRTQGRTDEDIFQMAKRNVETFSIVGVQLESAEFSATFWRLVMCAHSRRARVR
jgi:hypothetical protein